MKTRTITPKEAQRIIDIACNGWKATLAKKWAADIVLNKDITITDIKCTATRWCCNSMGFGRH